MYIYIRPRAIQYVCLSFALHDVECYVWVGTCLLYHLNLDAHVMALCVWDVGRCVLCRCVCDFVLFENVVVLNVCVCVCVGFVLVDVLFQL